MQKNARRVRITRLPQGTRMGLGNEAILSSHSWFVNYVPRIGVAVRQTFFPADCLGRRLRIARTVVGSSMGRGLQLSCRRRRFPSSAACSSVRRFLDWGPRWFGPSRGVGRCGPKSLKALQGRSDLPPSARERAAGRWTKDRKRKTTGRPASVVLSPTSLIGPDSGRPCASYDGFVARQAEGQIGKPSYAGEKCGPGKPRGRYVVSNRAEDPHGFSPE